MKKNPNQTANDLLAAMSAMRVETEVPKGWYSIAQLTEASGLSPQHTQKVITRKVKAGQAESRRFKPAGTSRAAIYYRSL